MSAIIATDLDRTLIYSARAAGLPTTELVLVERYHGDPLSYMHPHAIAILRALAARHTVVPVTTRTRAQYERVDLPITPAYAVCANGGTVLIDGEPDQQWSAQVAQQLTSGATLDDVTRYVETETAGAAWLIALRRADELFCYVVVDLENFDPRIQARWDDWAQTRGWNVTRQGRKIYWMPNAVTKGAAIDRVRDYLRADRPGATDAVVLATGDGQLDISLLLRADLAIRPRHGELEDIGFTSPTVTVTQSSGVAASVELLQWLADSADRWVGEQSSV